MLDAPAYDKCRYTKSQKSGFLVFWYQQCRFKYCKTCTISDKDKTALQPQVLPYKYMIEKQSIDRNIINTKSRFAATGHFIK